MARLFDADWALIYDYAKTVPEIGRRETRASKPRWVSGICRLEIPAKESELLQKKRAGHIKNVGSEDAIVK